MNLYVKFFIGLFIGCVGFLLSFIICAILSCPTNTMLLFCVSFLFIILICFIGFYISYNNLHLKIKKYLKKSIFLILCIKKSLFLLFFNIKFKTKIHL